MRHPFTKEESRKGGWTRARQQAAWRRENPTPAEQRVRLILTAKGWDRFLGFEFEYEIRHPDGRPQFVDIMIRDSIREHWLAVEVDGSHGWHGFSGHDTYGKMSALDELKAQWCREHRTGFIRINASDQGLSDEQIWNQITAAMAQVIKENEDV